MCDTGTTLATVNALNASSLTILWLCVSINVAIFSASLAHASTCTKPGCSFVLCTVTNKSVSMVRKPAKRHCPTWINDSSRFSTPCSVSKCKCRPLSAYMARSICFREYTMRMAPAHMAQQAPGA